MALKEAFPDLYDIACAKDASVATHLELFGGSNKWNIRFTRAAHDWEVDVIASFFRVLYSVRVKQEGKDKLWLAPSKRGLCDVKSFDSVLVCNDGFLSPLNSVWWTKIPLKATFFVWSAALGNIITMNNLRKHRVIVIDKCCMCKRKWEFIDNLLLHCKVACALWNVFFFFFFPRALGCRGLCLDEKLTCMLVGGLSAALEVLLRGRWYLCAFLVSMEGN
jgi:hypothetical protein